MISFYQRYISPIYHGLGKAVFGANFACRFQPTCSEYSREAIARYGIIQGIILSIKRFVRCNPFSQGGFDPVPKK